MLEKPASLILVALYGTVADIGYTISLYAIKPYQQIIGLLLAWIFLGCAVAQFAHWITDIRDIHLMRVQTAKSTTREKVIADSLHGLNADQLSILRLILERFIDIEDYNDTQFVKVDEIEIPVSFLFDFFRRSNRPDAVVPQNQFSQGKKRTYHIALVNYLVRNNHLMRAIGNQPPRILSSWKAIEADLNGLDVIVKNDV